jgi:recombination protein RecA
MATYKDIIARKKKEWNHDGLMDGAKAKRGPKIPFSSPLMNWATYGGIPQYRLTEFLGDPGGGKSTTSIDICKNAVKMFKADFDEEVRAIREKIAKGDKKQEGALQDLLDSGPRNVLYIDLENAFDGPWSKTLGVNADEEGFQIMQPPDVVAEDVLQTVQEIIQTGEVGLIVFDSIPSLVPKAELEKKYGERTVAALANLLTIFTRKIVPQLTRYKCTLLVINQTRDSQDNPYEIKSPGGRAVKYYCSLRIFFRVGYPVDFLGNELPMKTENPAGYKIMAKLIKQKTAPWNRKEATYFLMCDSGIRPDYDYAQLAVNTYSIIKKSGAWFTLTDPMTGEVIEDDKKQTVKLNGLAKVYQYLQDNVEYYEKLKKFVVDDIEGRTDVVESIEEPKSDEEGS